MPSGNAVPFPPGAFYSVCPACLAGTCKTMMNASKGKDIPALFLVRISTVYLALHALECLCHSQFAQCFHHERVSQHAKISSRIH